MHACALVFIPPGVKYIEEAVSFLMAPYDEDLKVVFEANSDYPDEGPYWTNPRSFWDWYQIGGRFTGMFDESYDPHLDQRNWETCIHCKGAGFREASGLKDGKPWCNACTGDHERYGVPLGVSVKWPTAWASHDGDVASPAQVLASLPEDGKLCYTLVCGETVLHRSESNPDWDRASEDYSNYLRDTPDFDQRVLEALRSAPEGTLVAAVDYHS